MNLVAAAQVSGTLMTAVNNVQLNGLGGTTSSTPTWIWLATGTGSGHQYLVITVNPVTGVTSIGTYSGTAPAKSLLLAALAAPPGHGEGVVGWDKAALAAAGPPGPGGIGGPAVASPELVPPYKLVPRYKLVPP